MLRLNFRNPFKRDIVALRKTELLAAEKDAHDYKKCAEYWAAMSAMATSRVNRLRIEVAKDNERAQQNAAIDVMQKCKNSETNGVGTPKFLSILTRRG